MATSSSDGSCNAPADFHLSSDLEEIPSRIPLNSLKCPLCHNTRRIFYCRFCVQNGDFVHSTSVYAERILFRFADKQLRLYRLKTARAQLEEKCKKALEKHKQKDKLICDINVCKERIRLLQLLVSETSQSISNGNKRLNSLKDKNSKLALKISKDEEKIEKLHKLATTMCLKQEKHKEAVDRQRQQLKRVIRIAAKQLIQYIFPLSQVQSSKSLCSSEEDVNADVVTCALADASGTSYVRGRWINDAENASEVQHRIIAPTLPGSGDYSAYSLWVAANKDSVPGTNKEPLHNPAYNISAALTFATQLVNIIAYYVNVKLPYKLSYGEFCGNEMSDQKFARKVARLNSNVLHLCFTQNTDIAVLHPMHTLQNLMHLLNTEISDLGRIGPMEVDSNVIAKLYSQLAPDLENSDDSASDEEEDAFNWEWEAVPNVACPEMTVPIPGSLANQQSSMQVNQSVAGGLVTSAAASIASIWRGWTTNK
ncbi:PREDICTED: beclin 1-associated autophagy-related key regulator isoform X1 [Polistes dominula]|uniref:Beclin 1-associated autophagy-related key regulator isoform X1 n=1 Tax=Polistes dominula TaxID=743375 RepID=A0ABM1I0F2_POLDO|nr:PREDICTED: beclin 1-associated autophagy-related key regulator isoform X1 [Polistes dominula]